MLLNCMLFLSIHFFFVLLKVTISQNLVHINFKHFSTTSFYMHVSVNNTVFHVFKLMCCYTVQLTYFILQLTFD